MLCARDECLLHYVQHPLAQMRAIAAFSLLFSAKVLVIAKLRRIECFVAPAVFTAVQLVFVGDPIGNK
jgi:hypothetical protein